MKRLILLLVLVAGLVVASQNALAHGPRRGSAYRYRHHSYSQQLYLPSHSQFHLYHSRAPVYHYHSFPRVYPYYPSYGGFYIHRGPTFSFSIRF